MKVLHVSDCYLPRLGGIELHVRDLAHQQYLAGHEVTIATRTEADGPAEIGAMPTPAVLRRSQLGRQTLREVAPDVVHVHLSVISPFALAAAQRAASLGLPTVVTVHSLWGDLARIAPLLRGTLALQRWPVVWTAVSRQAAAPVERVVGQEVGVIPNAVDVDYWRRARPGPSADYGEPTALAVMRLTGVKRAMPLVRILRQVSTQTSMRAVIVGDGPKRRAVQRYLRRVGLTDRVQLTGALGRAEVREHMARADLFIAPAYRESFGIAALEARTAGLPVVAPANSGVASFIRHGREGWLAEDDRGLADGILTLLREQEVRAEIGEHNRRVAPLLDWATAVRVNDEAYLLAEARAALGSAIRFGPRELVVVKR